MVGFKTFILIIQLLLLTACIPQMKQSACEANEAFNATLRSCVPVVPGPSAFLKIEPIIPTVPITAYKNSSSSINFQVEVYNPYGQTWNIEWMHTFAGNSTTITPTTVSSISSWNPIPAINFSTQVGAHAITIYLKTGTTVVDTHSFYFTISDLPKPTVISSTVLPSSYAVNTNPTTASLNFSFDVNNNTAAGLASYVVEWQVFKNGVLNTTLSPASTTAFSNTNLTGTNSFAFSLNPSAAAAGVGNYLVRASIINNAGPEVVAIQQWNLSITHPALSEVVSRNIYSGSASPAYPPHTTTIRAFNNTPHTVMTSPNFRPVGSTSQAEFCVQVADGAGTYPAIAAGVKVDYYLDFNTLIYSATTSSGSPEVCLSQAANTAARALLSFTNINPNSTEPHYVSARVFDLATNIEYTAADVDGGAGSLGSYPFQWTVSVSPQNAAPTPSFNMAGNTGTNFSCSVAASSLTTANCTAKQDENMSLGILITDEAWGSPYQTVNYTVQIYRNNNPLTDPGTFCTGPITLSPTGTASFPSSCVLKIPSYDSSTGPIDPSTNSYKIQASFCDVGSPFSSSVACNTTLLYNITTLIESNDVPAPAIVAQGTNQTTNSYLSVNNSTASSLNPASSGSYIVEGNNLYFNIKVNDPQRDVHKLRVYNCGTDNTCSSPVQVGAETTSIASGTSPLQTSVIVPISEEFLTPATTGTTAVLNYFKIEVTDFPSLPSTSVLSSSTNTSASPVHFSAYIMNYNPAPQFAGTPSPAVGSTSNVMVGHPITIYPGSVTDASSVASEATIKYRWYAKNIHTGALGTTYTTIPRVNDSEANLIWTPANYTDLSNIELRVCVSDSTAANPFPSSASDAFSTLPSPTNPANGKNCHGNWTINVRNNTFAMQNLGSTTSMTSPVAIWRDTTNSGNDKNVIYSAYVKSGKIHVDKTVVDTSLSPGKLWGDSETTGFRTVSFDAEQDGTQDSTTIKDISLVGTNTHLYIAYQSAKTSTPGQPRIRIRRIDKRYGIDATTSIDYGSLPDTNPSTGDFPHKGKFGFAYDSVTTNPHLPSFSSTVSTSTVSIGQSSLGQPVTVTFLNSLSSGDYITFINSSLLTAMGLTAPTISMTANDAPSSSQLCSGTTSGCTTVGNATRVYDHFKTNLKDRKRQGMTVGMSGSTAYLYGITSGAEYLDSHAVVSSFIPSKLGKISIDTTNNKWYLPFIDSSSAGYIGRVRVLYGDAGPSDVLTSTMGSVSTYVFPEPAEMADIESEYDNLNGRMVIVGRRLSDGKAELYSCAPLGSCTISSGPLFGSSAIVQDTLRLALPNGTNSSNNNNYYIAAKVVGTTNKWAISRITNLGVEDFHALMEDIDSTTSQTDSIFDDSLIRDISIQAFPSTYSSYNEARLMVISGASPKIYVARFTKDDELTCGTCNAVETEGVDLVAPTTHRLATSKIMNLSSYSMAIGSAGFGTNENIRELMFGIMPVQVPAAGVTPSYVRPYFGTFNVREESIQATAVGDGYRTPFVGD